MRSLACLVTRFMSLTLPTALFVPPLLNHVVMAFPSL